MEASLGTQQSSSPANERLVRGGLLLAIVLIAYLPALLHGGFVWDDDRYVTENPLLTAPDGWKQIWFSEHSQSQYFPLTYTTLRLERALWGLNPAGYHLVNVLMHGANAWMVWLLLARLQLPCAWLAAALFAVHPVNVESVAWITELKNTQSLLFFLTALVAWTRHRAETGPNRWRFYALSLVLYLAALLTKTTACVLPAALVLMAWMSREKLNRRFWAEVLPFVVIGAAMGLVSIAWERHLGSYQQEYGVALTWPQRVLLASRAIWFYAGKLVWPVDLTFSYPKWQLDPHNPAQFLWPAACLLVVLLLWIERHRISRAAMAGVLFFVAGLAPLLGFISNYTFRYSYVADHYQYIGCIGLLALIAGLLGTALKRLNQNGRIAVQALLLVALGVLTWRQSALYQDEETLWRDTAQKNPSSWLALNHLAVYAERRGALAEAAELNEKSARLNPNFEAFQNLGRVLARQNRLDEAIRCFERAIEMHPSGAIYYNLGTALAQKGDVERAVQAYRKSAELSPDRSEPLLSLASLFQQTPRTAEAIRIYEEVLKKNPASTEALRNLASIRASDADPRFRNAAEAIALADKLCQLTQYQDAFNVSLLASALAEAGRFPEAVATARRAEALATEGGDQDGVAATRRLRALFESGVPYHDVPQTNNPPVSGR